MSGFDPQKLFIGLMDFFSILLPGALLTFLVMDVAGPNVLGPRYAALDGASAGAAFLFASYLLGHLVFLLGSWLDGPYDRLRRHTLDAQVAHVVRRGRPRAAVLRALVWLVFKNERNAAVRRASALKQRALAPLGAADAINTFQWSKSVLLTQSPASLAVVQRFEADSKFFRCFAVVLLLLLAAWPVHRQWPLAGVPVVLVLLLLALWRYMEQRYKATNQAYWSVLALTAHAGGVPMPAPAPAVDGPSRAGGVVFRASRFRGVRYLLVEASDDAARWVLPKGHLEAGERHEEAAVREVLEETGTWAHVVDDLGDVTYAVGDDTIAVRVFRMQADARGLRREHVRRAAWLRVEDAIAKASHRETRELLQAAERQRVAATQAGRRTDVPVAAPSA